MTVTKPTGTVQNDVLIAAVMCNGGSTVTITPPSPFWNLILRSDISASAGADRTVALATYALVAGASEGASYTFDLGSAQFAPVAGILCYSGGDTTQPTDVSGDNQSGPTTTFTSLDAPTVTTHYANTRIIRVFAARRGGTTAGSVTEPAGYTERFETLQTNSTSYRHWLEASDVAQAAVGATGTATASQSTPVTYIAHTIAVAPAGSVVVTSTTDSIGMVGT